MTPCLRHLVMAVGQDAQGRVAYATNGNETKCTGVQGQCGCIHAEAALLQIMPNPKSVILTHSPCMACARLLIDAGVELVRYARPYRLSDGLHYLRRMGVRVEQRMSA